MTAYDAGTAFLQVVPAWRGWDAAVTAKIKETQEQLRKGIADALPAGFRDGARAAAPEGAKAGDEFGGAFARTVRARIEAALKALPKVELKADSSDTDRKIADIRARLEALRDKKIGIDIDEGAALAQIKVLTAELDRLGRKDPSIGVRVNAAQASAELAAIRAEVDKLDGKTARVNVGVSGGISLLGAGIAASPALIPLGAAAIGGLSGIATVAGAGTAGLGVLALGLSGVTKAVQDIATAHTQAGSAATASGAAQLRAALAVAGAERQVKAAEEGLAQARANAADAAISAQERVQSALQAQAAAERNLTTAQQNQRDAQTALTEARKTAAQQLQDLTNAVTDGQLGLRQGQLDVTNARLNLQNVNSNPLSTQQQRQQAQLDYDTAVQHLKELQTQQDRLGKAQTDAAKKGVDGADVVVQAQKNLAQATQSVTDAYLAQANAAQAVGDAQRAQAAQTRSSAYAIVQAQNSVASAQAAVQSAAISTASSTSVLQTQLHALSPAMLEFATFIESKILPAVAKLRAAAQGGLLPGLQQGLTSLLPVLPALTGFVGSLAKTMGDLFAQGAKALTSPFWEQFFSFVARTAGPILTTFAKIVGNLITGFAGLLQAFYPVSQSIGDGLLHLTQRFAEFGQHLGTNSAFQAFLAYVQQQGAVVASVLGNVVVMVGHLVEVLAPFGALVLSVTNSITGFLSAISPGALLAITEAAVAMFVAFKVGLIALKVNALESAGAFAVLNAVMDANPIGIVALAIGGAVAGIAYLASQSRSAAVQVDLLAQAEDQLTAAVSTLNGELKKSIDNFTILRDGALGQERANENLQAAFDAVTKSVQKNGSTLNINTQAGRENRTALTDVITALNDKVTADFKANQSTLGYQKALKIASEQVGENRRRLIALAVQSGLSEKAAKSLIDQILLTPKQVVTRFKTPDLNLAQANVDHLHKSLVSLRDGTWLVKVLLDPQMRTGTGDLTLGGILPAPKGRAAGGAIYGPGTWTSDTAGLFRLSTGEHVWPAREVAALGGQQAMYQLRHVLTGYASGGAVDSSAGLLSVAAGLRGPGLARLDALAGGAVQPLHYEQHLHYPVPDSVGHGQMRAQQLLLHELSNR
jgi:hypothetical protein